MEIAILGGTGELGEGLARRWGRDADHRIVVGSRERERAERSATAYRDALADRGVEAAISGARNPDAAAGADVAILAVPPEAVVETVDEVATDLGDAILVSPAVSLAGDDAGVHYAPPEAGSVTARVADAAPANVPVVGAFHTLAAGRLADLDRELGLDAIVVGDDAEARGTVADLAEAIDGLRALDGGPLANAPEVESLTAVEITLARYGDGLRDVGVRFV